MRPRTLERFFLLGWVLCAAQLATAAPRGQIEIKLDLAGSERRYLLHVPRTHDPARPSPLVIMLHGGGGTADNAVRETGWSAKADAEDFIVAYPDAVAADPGKPGNLRNNPQTWNDGSGRFGDGKQAIDDVAFIRALIDDVGRRQAIDAHRIYVTGFSNGASMAFRAGAELADRIAAIAPVAGATWFGVKPSRGVSVYYLTGTADPLNPMEGGMPRFGMGGKPKPPVAASIDRWVAALACPATAVQDDTANGVRTRRHGPCRDGAEIVLTTVEGLGHIWAGGKNLLPEKLVGKPTKKLNATDAIWAFFRAHPAP